MIPRLFIHCIHSSILHVSGADLGTSDAENGLFPGPSWSAVWWRRHSRELSWDDGIQALARAHKLRVSILGYLDPSSADGESLQWGQHTPLVALGDSNADGIENHWHLEFNRVLVSLDSVCLLYIASVVGFLFARVISFWVNFITKKGELI